MRIISLLCLLFISVPLSSQIQYDNKLLFGRRNGVILNFENGEPIVENIDTDFFIDAANASICDDQGDLLFYTNGCNIYNKHFEIMLNGDSISNLSILHLNWCGGSGSPINQSALILPKPGNTSDYFVLHNDLSSNGFVGRIYYSLVDMASQDGDGEVVTKNKVLYTGDISRSSMAATKHANGIDWWVICPLLESNGYLRFLVSENGIERVGDVQNLGHVWDFADIQGQQVFSPNGEIYSRFTFQNGLNIFNFDNNTGLLSNSIQIEFDFIEEEFFVGVAISPNSRFLYANAINTVHQFDLQAEDIPDSRVLVGELEARDSLMFQTRFYRSFLGPNGKIYIGGNFQFNYLHTIHNPDCKGLKSNLEQYSIKLDEFPGFSTIGVPHIPHFRNQAQEINCDTVDIVSTTSTISFESENISIYPNPVEDLLTIEMENIQAKFELIKIVSILGQENMSVDVNKASSNKIQISTSTLDSGMYYLLFIDAQGKIKARKKVVRL